MCQGCLPLKLTCEYVLQRGQTQTDYWVEQIDHTGSTESVRHFYPEVGVGLGPPVDHVGCSNSVSPWRRGCMLGGIKSL